jgi:60 kDa SS-A/Ro ribonucleoprotein
MLPDAALDHAATWDALLDAGIPQTALLRQLPRLTRLGLAGPFRAGRTDEIVAQLTDPTRLQAARVHPIAVLTALRSYASGVSRGGVTWTPVTELVDALDTAFHAAFATVEPANKRTLIGLDVSASMDQARDSSGVLTARDVGAAMALVLAATEPQVGVFGFTTTDQTQWRESTVFSPLAISGRQRLDDAVASTRALPFGGTDCALPMTEATRNGWAVDTFIVITDNETWAGPIHPHQALEHYRRQTGLPARLIVLAVTPTRFSIADPGDAGMLDVVGFGGDVPELVTAFSRGF